MKKPDCDEDVLEFSARMLSLMAERPDMFGEPEELYLPKNLDEYNKLKR